MGNAGCGIQYCKNPATACFEKKEIRSEVYVKAMRELKAIVLKVNKWFHTGTKIQILQNLQIVHQSEDHQLPLLL